jgi:hypothetical protein
METPHAILTRKHLRYQQTSVPNLDDSSRPIQRLHDAQVHDFAIY